MENRTEPKTVWQWIRYLVVAVIAIWLVIWMLRLSGINVRGFLAPTTITAMPAAMMSRASGRGMARAFWRFAVTSTELV